MRPSLLPARSGTGIRRTSSGEGGSDSGGGAEDRRYYAWQPQAPAFPSVRPPVPRRRRSRTAQAAAPWESFHGPGTTWLWGALAVGLTFCLLDTLYIVQLVMRGERAPVSVPMATPAEGGVTAVSPPQVAPPQPLMPEPVVRQNFESVRSLGGDAAAGEPPAALGLPEPVARDGVESAKKPRTDAAVLPRPTTDVPPPPPSPPSPPENAVAPVVSPDGPDPQEVTRVLAALEANPEKAPLLRLLRDAKVDLTGLDPAKLARLPDWSAVTALYGAAPVYVGLATCRAFQHDNVAVPDPADHFVSTAGTFNTGTNLMAELLIGNCRMPARLKKYGPSQRGVRWQVLWGKHTPVFNETFRQQHRTYKDDFLTASAIFPAVTVRDPLKWAQSMCRHEYGALWPHFHARSHIEGGGNASAHHCPNLVPTAFDQELMAKRNMTVSKTGAVPVTVQYAEFSVKHDSLIDFWNDWYREYVYVKWPRLLVRFEDLVFFPQQVTKTVCECAGGELNPARPFKFIVESAKRGDAAHGKLSERTTYIDALIKYGTEEGRYRGYTREDLVYLREHLDPELMELFHYKYPRADVADQELQ